MASANETLLPLEGEPAGRREDYERWREDLHKLAAQFADKHDLSFAMMALLLIDIGVSSRMIDYVFSVEKPSPLGLRLDLDRFQREIGDFLRSSKKTAEGFIEATMKALDEAEAASSPDPDRRQDPQ
jgi:hypothetical protein